MTGRHHRAPPLSRWRPHLLVAAVTVGLVATGTALASARSVTVYGSPAAIRCCINAEQKRHGRIHAKADHIRMTLPLPRKDSA